MKNILPKVQKTSSQMFKVFVFFSSKVEPLGVAEVVSPPSTAKAEPGITITTATSDFGSVALPRYPGRERERARANFWKLFVFDNMLELAF